MLARPRWFSHKLIAWCQAAPPLRGHDGDAVTTALVRRGSTLRTTIFFIFFYLHLRPPRFAVKRITHSATPVIFFEVAVLLLPDCFFLAPTWGDTSRRGLSQKQLLSLGARVAARAGEPPYVPDKRSFCLNVRGCVAQRTSSPGPSARGHGHACIQPRIWVYMRQSCREEEEFPEVSESS